MHPVRLNRSHALEYRGLMLEAYAQHPDAFTSSLNERACLPLSWWEQRLAEGDHPDELVLGSFAGGQLVGVVGLSFEQREKIQHKATLFGMYVPAGFRNIGLGSRLVRQALVSAKSRPGVTVVQLTMTDGNHAAQALYQRHGFASFGLEPNAVALGDGFVSKLHMWCNLATRC